MASYWSEDTLKLGNKYVFIWSTVNKYLLFMYAQAALFTVLFPSSSITTSLSTYVKSNAKHYSEVLINKPRVVVHIIPGVERDLVQLGIFLSRVTLALRHVLIIVFDILSVLHSNTLMRLSLVTLITWVWERLVPDWGLWVLLEFFENKWTNFLHYWLHSLVNDLQPLH